MFTPMDWKFIVTLAVTAFGVAIPFYVYKADQAGKALEVHILSRAPLGPQVQDSMPGLQIVVEGTPLTNPFLSILEVSNTGDKPITTRDFETPLAIKVDPPVS